MPSKPTSTLTTPAITLCAAMATLAAAIWFISISTILNTIAATGHFMLGDKFPAFEDIIIYRNRFLAYHTANFFKPVIHLPHLASSPTGFAYPPAAALVYAIFYKFPKPDILITVLIGLWTILIFAFAARTLSPHLTSKQTTVLLISLTTFSFPLIFLADRSNIELIVWMILAAATLLYLKDHPIPAAILIGVAASIKLYPILLLGLFFSRRRDIPSIFIGLFTAIATTIFAIWYAGPTFSIAFNGFVDGVLRFNHQHAEAARATEAVFDHSLFAPLKDSFIHQHGSPTSLAVPYFLIAGSLVLALFIFRVRKLPTLNRLVFLTVAMITLPPVSYEYTLTHLYLPLLLLLLTLITTDAPKSALLALACFLSVMLPLALLQNGTFLQAGEIQSLTLALLAIVAAANPWPAPNSPLVSS